MTLPLGNYSAASGISIRPPRRYRLTKGFDGTTNLRTNNFGVVPPFTCAMAFNIEAPAYAVRVGFSNIFNAAITYNKATIWPSTTYADFQTSTVDQGTVVPHSWTPTGGGTASPLYFDGLADDQINTAGVTRALTLPAVTGNASNVPAPQTFVWSDWSPLVDLPRTDGGVGRILMLFLTMGTAAMASTILDTHALNADTLGNRGRQFYFMAPWTPTNGDFADNPGGSTAKYAGFYPTVVVQYLTLTPGYQLLIAGDSLAGGNPTPCCSMWRAAMDLSSSSGYPVEVANMAWGGTASPIWAETVRLNYAKIQPSLFIPQSFTHNDPVSVAIEQQVLGKLLAMSHSMRAQYDTHTLFQIPGLATNADGNTVVQSGWKDIVARLQDAYQSGAINLFDATKIISNYSGGASWDYLPGFSSDNTHPNAFACEECTPEATRLLSKALGLS